MQVVTFVKKLTLKWCDNMAITNQPLGNNPRKWNLSLRTDKEWKSMNIN